MDLRDEKKTHYVRRFLDRKDKRDFIKKAVDFKLRRHGAPIVRVVFYFIVVILFTIWLLNNFIYSIMYLPPTEPPPKEAIINALGSVVFAIAIAGLVAIYILYRVRENVLEAEFQSMVFASGMRVNNNFCIIVHKEKAGFYCDYTFSELFSDYGKVHHDPFHQLIASQGFKQSDEDLLLNAMQNGEAASFTFTLKRQGKKPQKMKVTLDPLERPNDFFIIRGTYV